MSTSLFNRRLRWTDVARLLEIGYESASLPTLVTCPLCQGHTLRVYDDTAARGAWFHCSGCTAGGDCVTFAAAVWHLDVPGTVERLIAADLLSPSARDHVGNYMKLIADQNARVAEFWAAASGNLPAAIGPGVARLTNALMVNTDLPPERWRAGMGLLLGAATKPAVDVLFNPNMNSDLGGNTSRTRPFKGKGRGWYDLLVLPYHSSAGKVSGFTFVGRRGEPAGRVFVPVRAKNRVARADAGLYAPVAAEGHSAVVAVRDDCFALKLHGKHFATSSRFLNLIAWRDDGTHATGRHCWQQLNGKRVIHWVQQIDAAVVRQAFHFDADVSTAGPDRAGMTFDHYCRLVDPPDLMRRVARQARPWRYALADWLREAHGGPVEVMARQLAAYGIDPHEIARSLPDREAADRLHELTGPRRGLPGLRHVEFDKGRVQARPDGWYYTNHRPSLGPSPAVRVSDFTLTVNQIRVLPTGERYDCDVYFRGRLYPVEIDPDQPIARQLLRAGVGVVFVSAKWTRRLLRLATTFDSPKIVQDGP